MISRLINPHFGISAAFRWMIVPLLVITIALATMVTTQSGTAFADTGSDTPADSTSTANGYEPNLWLKCLDKEVEEGDDYRLEVRRKGGFGSDIKQCAFTGTPTQSPPTRQTTTRSTETARRATAIRAGSAKMGRDFYTRQDQYPEIDETFKVRFDNSVDYGDDDYCIMTITDDDTPGHLRPQHNLEWIAHLDRPLFRSHTLIQHVHRRRCHKDRGELLSPGNHAQPIHWQKRRLRRHPDRSG